MSSYDNDLNPARGIVFTALLSLALQASVAVTIYLMVTR